MGRPLEPPANQIPPDIELEHAATVAGLLADRTRLGILALLLPDAELSVTEIAHRLERAVPAVSQHLAKLKSGHFVIARREGTSMRYRLRGEHVALLLENLLQHTEHELYADPRTTARPAPAAADIARGAQPGDVLR